MKHIGMFSVQQLCINLAILTLKFQWSLSCFVSSLRCNMAQSQYIYHNYTLDLFISRFIGFKLLIEDVDHSVGQHGKGCGQYIPALTTHSVNKSFIALPINPNNFIEKIEPAQQNSPAESSCEFTSTLLIDGD